MERKLNGWDPNTREPNIEIKGKELKMSLFTLEEICLACRHAVYHQCCKNFCHCKIADISEPDFYIGKCEQKERQNEVPEM